MKQFISLMAAGAVMAVQATNSSAQTETFNTSTPISSQATDWASTLSFQQFNPSLGTLDSVTLDLSSGMSTTLTINNNGHSSSKGFVLTDVTVAVEDAGNNFIADAPQLNYDSTAFSYRGLGAGQSVTSGLLTGSETYTSEAYTAANILSEFTGAGDINLDASTLTMTDMTYNGGNTGASQVTDADLTGSVTYVYSPPPAPTPRAPDEASTFSLLVLGLGVLPFIRRPRK